MADPLRDPVYEREDENPVIRPKLRGIEGGGEGDGKGSGDLKSVPPEDLERAERSGLRGIEGGGEGDGKAAGNLSAVDNKEEALLGRGYRENDKGNFFSLKGRLGKWTRKKTATVAVVAVLGGGGIFGMSILQGPTQLVHLSQILQRNMSGSEDSSDKRVRGIYTWARTGEAGYTRVGTYGQYVMTKQLKKWESMGIKMETGTNFGTPKSQTFELGNDKNPFNKYNGLSRESAAWLIAKDLGVDVSQVSTTSGQGQDKVVKVSYGSLDRKSTQEVLGNLRENTDPNSGKIANFINKRINKKFYGTDLLHKFRKSSDDAADRKAAKAAERERQKENRKTTREKVLGKKAEVSDKAKKGGITAASVALGGVQTVCTVHDLSSLVPEFNKAFRDDSVAAAYDMISVGSQIQDGGKDVDMQKVGGVIDNFKDENGKSIWGAKGLQAASGKTEPSGTDIDKNMRQAYTGESSWDDIHAFTGSIPGVDNDTFGPCSTPGQIVIGLAGLGLVVATGPGGGVIYQATKIVGGAVAGAAVMNLATNLITPDFSSPEVISGAVGGNFVAYGAREAANVDARAHGGVELSNSESAAIDRQIAEKSQEEFSKKSFFARMFDLQDYRSLASMSIGRTNISSSGILSYLGNSLNPKNTVSKLSAAITPRASAADKYDWGFNRYGIRKSVLEDSKYEDPVENAEKAIDAVKNDSGLADRAKGCFGVELNEENNGFTVVENPDQYGEEYHNSNCNDTSEAWNRISLAVFDDSLAGALACYEADDTNPDDELGTQACQDIEGSQAQEVGATNTDAGDLNIEKIDNPLNTSGDTIDPKGITLHWWSGRSNGNGINALVDALRGNSSCSGGCSVQLGITADGKVYQLTNKLTDLTYHAIGANNTTIGIEIEGVPADFGREGIKKYPEKFEAVVKTVKYLMEKYDIPAEGPATCGNVSGVHPHKAYNKCPGAYEKDDIDDYYFNEVMKRVKE